VYAGMLAGGVESPEDNTGGRTNTSASRYNHIDINRFIAPRVNPEPLIRYNHIDVYRSFAPFSYIQELRCTLGCWLGESKAFVVAY